MTPIPFPRQSGPYEDLGATGERLVNLFVEQLPADASGPVVIRATPGLRLFEEAGAGPIYASATHSGTAYFVSGNQFYRIVGLSGTPELLGSLAGGEWWNATIACGTLHVVVCAPPLAWYMLHGGSSLVAITDPDFEQARSVAHLDGFYIFNQFDAPRLFTSDLDDPSAYNALAFGKLEEQSWRADVLNREVWAFGFDRIGIFYNAGTSPFPLARQATGMIEVGCMAPRSVVKLSGAFYWLGSDGVIYRGAGLRAERVSTHAVERSFLRGGDPALSVGIGFTQAGHACYALTRPDAPGGGHTWVLDTVTGLWHEKMSGAAGRWRGQTAFNLGPIPFVGDAFSGKIFSLEEMEDNEDGETLNLIAVLPPVVSGGRERLFMSVLDLDMEVGSATGPVVVRLDWSDDRGNTFMPARTVEVRAAANRRQRVRFTRLGSFRNRTLRIRTLGRANFYGADADLAQGMT